MPFMILHKPLATCLSEQGAFTAFVYYWRNVGASNNGISFPSHIELVTFLPNAPTTNERQFKHVSMMREPSILKTI